MESRPCSSLFGLAPTCLRFSKSRFSVFAAAEDPIGRRRHLSTSHTTSEKESENLPTYVTLFREHRDRIVRIGYVSLGCVVAYSVSKAIMSTTNAFLSIPPHSFIYYGFVAGFLSAGVCGTLAYAARKAVTIRPENVFRLSKSLVEENAQVQRLLGHLTTPGKLKAYKIDGGNFTIRSGSLVPTYKYPRVQMLYNVFGTNGKEGMVTVEMEKVKGSLVPRLVAVDIGSELHLVAGLRERLEVASQLRGFLLAERGQYIKQHIDEDDGDEVEPMIQ